MNENVFLNAIALLHVNKTGGEMLNDFSSLMKNEGENLTVSQLLDMPVDQFIKTNANEVMSTGQAGFGKEFVQEVVLEKELIERLKASGNLLGRINYKTMLWPKLDIPVRGAKVRMIGTSENSDYPRDKDTKSQTKKLGTPKITLEAKELVITIYYSDSLLEDSVINMAEYVLDGIRDAYASSLLEGLLNGDKTATANANINAIDGDVADLIDGALTDTLKFNGARKLSISKWATVNAGANLVLENIRSARAKMGIKGVNPKDLALVPDIQTYFYLMNLTEVETIEKFWDTATIKEGVLVAIDGIKIENQEEMYRATATGEISKTPANNTKGQIAIIHCPSVFVGLRRGLTAEGSRYAEDRTTGITGSARFDIGFNDVQNNTQPTSPVALITNI